MCDLVTTCFGRNRPSCGNTDYQKTEKISGINAILSVLNLNEMSFENEVIF